MNRVYGEIFDGAARAGRRSPVAALPRGARVEKSRPSPAGVEPERVAKAGAGAHGRFRQVSRNRGVSGPPSVRPSLTGRGGFC